MSKSNTSRKRSLNEVKMKDKHTCYICKKEMRYGELVNRHFPTIHPNITYRPPQMGQKSLSSYMPFKRMKTPDIFTI